MEAFSPILTCNMSIYVYMLIGLGFSNRKKMKHFTIQWNRTKSFLYCVQSQQ